MLSPICSLLSGPYPDLHRLVTDHAGRTLSTICRQLKLVASDGKKYETDCANTERIFRIIQSIPSPKAEPFKQWLAKLGRERLEEIENPELGIARAREFYEQKGYPREWIERRVQGLSVRKELTDEWGERGAKESKDFAILTNDISRSTFGMSALEHKELKGLKERRIARPHEFARVDLNRAW